MNIISESDGVILLDEIADDYESGVAVVSAALRVALNRLGKQGNINDVYEEVIKVIVESQWEARDSQVALGV